METGMEEIPAKVPSSSFGEDLDPSVMKPTSETGIAAVRAGSWWSEIPLRRCVEAELVTKVRDEQQRTGVPQRDWIGNDRFQQEFEKKKVSTKLKRVFRNGNPTVKLLRAAKKWKVFSLNHLKMLEQVRGCQRSHPYG